MMMMKEINLVVHTPTTRRPRNHHSHLLLLLIWPSLHVTITTASSSQSPLSQPSSQSSDIFQHEVRKESTSDDEIKSHLSVLPSETINLPPKLIVISFDGFRPGDVSKENTPNLFRLSSYGVTGHRMKPAFTTKTYPNHMSISTGLHEETHGVVHNEMWDPVFNQTFDAWNIEEKWWAMNPRSLPIWIANEKHNDGLERNSGVIMWPGSEVSYHGTKPRYIEVFEPKADWERNIDLVIKWMTNETHPANNIFIYLNEPDSAAHDYGPNSPEVKEQLRRIDSWVGNLLKRLESVGLRNQVNFIFLSDHGFTEVTEDRVILLNTFLPRHLYDMYGGSPVWNIKPKSGKLDLVYETLLNHSHNAHFSVYKKADSGVPPEYYYRDNRRILDIVIVADEGYDIVDSVKNLKGGKGRVWGNHGYNNSLESMRPLFIASGPAFQEHFGLYESFNNIDLYPLMCMVLHIIPLPSSQGSLQVIYQILKPITRPAPVSTDNVFSLMTSLFIGCAFIVAGACCFVFCSGLGKPKKRVETTWDPGVTDFDLTGGMALDDIQFRFVRGQTNTSESVLLLDDLDDDDDFAVDNNSSRERT